MNTKLILLAAVLFAAVGSSVALAGRDKTPAPKSSTSCCATAKNDATSVPKNGAPKNAEESCHVAAPAAKSCCK